LADEVRVLRGTLWSIDPVCNPVIALIVLPSTELTTQTSLAASQILDRSQKAYSAVRTFEEDVVASAGRVRATAHISFQRPGYLRVTGMSMFHSKYDLVCHGSEVWLLTNGKWARQSSAEIGIAAITGISLEAGARVPAAILGTTWASMPTVAGASKLKSGAAKGRTVYRIDYTDPYPADYWFDGNTYFLIKTNQTIMGRTISIECAPPTVNKSIPASRFTRGS